VSEAQNPIPSPLTQCTVYAYALTLIIHKGKRGGGRVKPERRFEGQQFP